MNLSYTAVREEIRCSIMRQIDFSRDVPDSEVLDLIDSQLTNAEETRIALMTLE